MEERPCCGRPSRLSEPEKQKAIFAAAAREILQELLGESATNALISFIGPPEPETFLHKLYPILGSGAKICAEAAKRRAEEMAKNHSGKDLNQ